MACYHPLRGAFLHTKSDSGKRQVKVFKAAETGNTYVYQSRSNPAVFECSDHQMDVGTWRQLDTFLIPCGRCIGCRLDYSRRWATRLMLELQTHTSAFFVTLTYDDEHLPRGTKGIPSLVPDDVQKFIKRLRRDQDYRGIDTKIRFFLAGEYGEQSHRPHYHLILFDWIPPEFDLQFLKYSKNGDKYYTSLSLQKLWPYGYNLVAGVTWQSCAYVARYILKKQTGDNAHVYEDMAISPEFTRMSRKPGIGKEYYDLHAKKLLEDGYVQLEGGLKAPIPRYFDPFFEIDFPEEYQKLSENRVATAKMMQEVKEFATELDYFEQLLIDEQQKIHKSKMLVRPDI